MNSNNRSKFVGAAVIALVVLVSVGVAVVMWFRVQQAAGPVSKLIADPHAVLAEREIRALVDAILEGRTASSHRDELVKALVIRHTRTGDTTLLGQCIVQRWHRAHEYTTVPFEIRRAVTERDPNCGRLLNALCAYDIDEARKIVEDQEAWDTADLFLLATMTMIASDATLADHADELHRRMAEPGFPTKLRAAILHRLPQAAQTKAGGMDGASVEKADESGDRP